MGWHRAGVACLSPVLAPIQDVFVPIGQVADAINNAWAPRRSVIIPTEIIKLQNITGLSSSWANVLREAYSLNRTAFTVPQCFNQIAEFKAAIDCTSSAVQWSTADVRSWASVRRCATDV